MARAASFILSLFVLAGVARALPQDDPRLQPALKAADLKNLNSVAQKWIEAELKWDEDPKQRSKRDKARQKFMEALEKKSKKTDPLASVGNMLAMFDRVFPYKRKSTSGEVRRAKEGAFSILEPRPYKHTDPYPSVLVLPAWDEAKSAWKDSKSYLSDTWKNSTHGKSVFSIAPDLRKGDDYDRPADLSTDKGQLDEMDRIRGVLAVFGEVQRSYHLDRERMFLDCGPGTAGFGLRLLTYFPSRFAGVILRKPVDHGEMQLESLVGLPVLMVVSDANKATAEKLKKALEDLQPGSVTSVADGPKVVEVIDEWVGKVKRRLYPREVIVAPNHDRFHKSFWVEIISCEPLDAVKKEERPLLRVKADLAKNQITVTARSVSEIGLYLNDYIVDLDKEVTFVVNGKEIPGEKFQRSIRTVERYMRRAYDPTALYTAYHRMQIPKIEKAK